MPEVTKSVARNILSGFVAGTFLGALAVLFFIPVPEDNEQLIVFMLGQLSGFMGGVIAYHFGSTKGSTEKDHMLYAATPPRRAGDPEGANFRGAHNALDLTEEMLDVR